MMRTHIIQVRSYRILICNWLLIIWERKECVLARAGSTVEVQHNFLYEKSSLVDITQTHTDKNTVVHFAVI
jgi:hypothetical protein